LPVEGYQNKRLMPLEEAVEPLFHIFDSIDLRTKVFIAKERCQQRADGLSQDESASIMLYTFEWDTSESTLKTKKAPYIEPFLQRNRNP
jgi:hypothetical protein